MTRVLHVIPALSRGGAGRALLAHAAPGVEHAIASLRAADALMARTARERGMDVLDAPDRAALLAAVARADIAEVHFWNDPLLYELLYGGVSATRLVVWSHVSGVAAPQVLTPELVAYADRVIATSAFAGLPVIRPVPGWRRLEGLRRSPGARYTVGYVGTLDFAKLHPDFVALSARVGVEGARFRVCGDGGALPALRRQAAAHGERFEFAGFVEDLRPELGAMDVFGYPLAPGNTTTAELVLQEAMWAGVPPVVLGASGAREAIRHGRNGLLADTPEDYVAALERLHERPAERRALGAAAGATARAEFSPERVQSRWAQVYDELMARAPRARGWPDPPTGGAPRFLAALGGMAPQFAAGDDEAIARSSGALVTGGGGVLHYRDHYPGDPLLRYWAGLVLEGQGRAVPAAGEYAAAQRLGCDAPGLRARLAGALARAGAR